MLLALAALALALAARAWPPWLGLLILPCALLYGWVLWFFRDPPRVPPEGDGLVLAPADGVVTHMDEVDDPGFLGGRALRLSIFLSVFDVHLNRAPLAGTVAYCRHIPGKFHDARAADSHEANERQDLGLDTGDARCPRALVRQTAGLIARRIVCALKPGDRIERGAVYGMIKFGSRTTVFLPADARIAWNVAVGDKVRAGVTILGRLE